MTTATANIAKQVADTIYDQLGRKTFVMVGASHVGFSTDSDGNHYLSFKIGRNAKKVTHIRITLMPDDTYTMTFIRIYNYKYTIIAKREMVYADQMNAVIEDETGLATRL